MRSFLRSLAALLSVHAGTLLGGTLLPIILTRFLGAEALGIFTLAASFGLLLLTFIDWGYETRLPLLISSTPEASLNLISQAQYAKFRLWLIALVIFVLLGIVQYVLLIHYQILTDYLPHTFDPAILTLLMLYAIWAIVRGMVMTYSAVLRGFQCFSAIARIENVWTLTSHSTAIFMVMVSVFRKNTAAEATSMQTEQVFMLLCGIIICFTLGETAKLFSFRKQLQTHTIEYRENSSVQAPAQAHKRFFSFSDIPHSWSHLVFVMMQTVGIIQSRAGIYALMLFSTPLEIGLAGAVMRFTIAMRLLPGALFHVLLPHFVRSPHKETLRKALTIGLGIGLTGSFGLYITAEWLISLLYGTQLLSIAPLLRLSAWLFCLQTLGQVAESYLLSQHKEQWVNAIMFLCLCGFGVLCLLTPTMSAYLAVVYSLILEGSLLLAFGVIILKN